MAGKPKKRSKKKSARKKTRTATPAQAKVKSPRKKAARRKKVAVRKLRSASPRKASTSTGIVRSKARIPEIRSGNRRSALAGTAPEAAGTTLGQTSEEQQARYLQSCQQTRRGQLDAIQKLREIRDESPNLADRQEIESWIAQLQIELNLVRARENAFFAGLGAILPPSPIEVAALEDIVRRLDEAIAANALARALVLLTTELLNQWQRTQP